MAKPKFSLLHSALLTIYGAVNLLFVYKYGMRTAYSIQLLVGYTGILALILFWYIRHNAGQVRLHVRKETFASIVILAAGVLFTAMRQFNPGQIQVGRYPALNEWLMKIVHGNFPYASDTHPSGFPFLFLLAAPFYLLGDLGLFQIFSFLLFACVCYLDDPPEALRTVIVLLGAPIFWYEIVVRSELFSNMVLVLLYLAFFSKYHLKGNTWRIVVLGIMAGFLASTRGIVVLPLVTFLTFMLKNQLRDGVILFFSGTVSFLLTLAPFVIWNAGYFTEHGPFAIQLSYIPPWLLVTALALSVIIGVKANSLKMVYGSLPLILFAILGAVFFTQVMKLGWSRTIFQNGFDISYFMFLIPFILFALNQKKEILDEART